MNPIKSSKKYPLPSSDGNFWTVQDETELVTVTCYFLKSICKNLYVSSCIELKDMENTEEGIKMSRTKGKKSHKEKLSIKVKVYEKKCTCVQKGNWYTESLD